jgi:hypothetical protein
MYEMKTMHKKHSTSIYIGCNSNYVSTKDQIKYIFVDNCTLESAKSYIYSTTTFQYQLVSCPKLVSVIQAQVHNSQVVLPLHWFVNTRMPACGLLSNTTKFIHIIHAKTQTRLQNENQNLHKTSHLPK